MQKQVHGTEPGNTVHDFDTMQGVESQKSFLFTVEIGIMRRKIVMRREEKATRPTRRITDRLAWLGSHDVNKRVNQGSRGEVLPCTCLGILGILLQQSFVGIAFDVSIQDHPLFAVNEVRNQPTEFCRVLNFVLGFPKDDPQHALLFAQFLEHMTVMGLQPATIFSDETLPVKRCGNDRWLTPWWLGSFVCHLEKEQIRQLLDVVAIGQAIVTQEVTVTPEF